MAPDSHLFPYIKDNESCLIVQIQQKFYSWGENKWKHILGDLGIKLKAVSDEPSLTPWTVTIKWHQTVTHFLMSKTMSIAQYFKFNKIYSWKDNKKWQSRKYRGHSSEASEKVQLKPSTWKENLKCLQNLNWEVLKSCCWNNWSWFSYKSHGCSFLSISFWSPYSESKCSAKESSLLRWHQLATGNDTGQWK